MAIETLTKAEGRKERKFVDVFFPNESCLILVAAKEAVVLVCLLL